MFLLAAWEAPLFTCRFRHMTLGCAPSTTVHVTCAKSQIRVLKSHDDCNSMRYVTTSAVEESLSDPRDVPTVRFLLY